ncbi:Nuclear receptor coactivator 2, partial [Trichinella britovi]
LVNMGMLEFCKTRKLIIFVFTALVLIVLVFIFENSILIDEHDLYRSPEKIHHEQSNIDLHCWQKEDFEILESCKLCSEFEKEASNINNCTEASSYYDKVNCTNSGVAFRPCENLVRNEIRRYFVFMILCYGLSVLFLVMVKYRSAALDREKQLRIRKQFEMETSYSTSKKKAELSVIRQLSRQEWENSVTWARQSYDGSSDWPHFRILLKPNFQSALDTQTVPDSADRGDRKEKKKQLVLMQTVELVDDFFETFSPTTTGIVQSPDLVFSSPLSENVESVRQNNLDNATSMMNNISPSGTSSLFSPAVFNNNNNNNNGNGSTSCLVTRSAEVDCENFPSQKQADFHLPTPNTATEQQKSQYFSELVELLQENLCSTNDSVDSGVLCSNRQLVQEVVQHWNREKEKKENIIQHGDVSSTALSLSASHIGPILLGVLDSFFFVMNTEGLIEYISDNVVKYLKFHQSDMLNQPIFKFVSNADRPLFEQLLPDSLAFNFFNFGFPTDVVGFEKKRQSRTFCCRFLIKDSKAISILNDVDNILSQQKPNAAADCTFETMHVSAMSLPYPKEMRADYDFLSLSPSTAVSQPCLVCVVRPADSDSEQGALRTGGSNNVCVQREICAKEQQPLLNFYCSMDSQILQCTVKNCTNPALCALETEAVKYKLIALCCNEDRDLLENNLNTAYEKGFATVDKLRLKNPVAIDQGVVVVSLKSQLLSQNAEAFSLAVNRQWPVVHLECTILQTADVKQSVDMRSARSLESGTSTRDVETSIASLSTIASSLSSPASVVASSSAAKSVWPSQTNSFLDISLERAQFSEKSSVGDEYNFHPDMQQMGYNFVQPLDKIDDGGKVPQDDFERLLSEVFDTKQPEPLMSRATEVKSVEQPKPSEVKSDLIGQHTILRHLLNQDESVSLQQGFSTTAGDSRVLSAATFVGGDMLKMVADRKQLHTDECSRPRGSRKTASLAATNHAGGGGSAAKKRAYKNGGSQQQDSWPRMHQQPTRGNYGGRKQANTTRNSLLVKLLEQRSPLSIVLPTSIATQAMDRPPPQPLAADGLHMPLTLMTNVVTNQQYPSESYRHGHGVYGSSTSFQPSSYYPVTPEVPKAEPLVHDLTEDSFLQNRYTTAVCQRYYSMPEDKLSLTSPAYGTDILECSPQQQMINPATPTTAYCVSANDTLSANCQQQYASPHRNGYQLSQQTQNLPLFDRRISSTYLQNNNNNCNSTNSNNNKNAAIVGKRPAVSDERSADFADTSCYISPAYAKTEMPKRFQTGYEIDPTRTTNNLAELDFDRNKFATVKHQYTAATAAFPDAGMQSNTELVACQSQPDLKSFFDIG